MRSVSGEVCEASTGDSVGDDPMTLSPQEKVDLNWVDGLRIPVLSARFGYLDLAEAYAMSYIVKHTSIPVPKVQRAWRSNGITYVVMDVVRGVELAYAWHNMSQDTKDWVIVQLKDYIA